MALDQGERYRQAAEDAQGHLYVTSLEGEVFRLRQR